MYNTSSSLLYPATTAHEHFMGQHMGQEECCCRCGHAIPPDRQRIPTWKRLLHLFFRISRLLLPSVCVVVALHLSISYVLLVVSQVVVALGSLELSWWLFRIRKRVMLALQCDEESITGVIFDYDHMQCSAMNDKNHMPIAQVAEKWLGGRKAVGALLITSMTTAVVIAIVLACRQYIELVTKSPFAWRMIVTCSAVGTSCGIFCACFAPTVKMAFVVIVYQVCFTVASLNTFLANYQNLIKDPQLLEFLYVTLISVIVLVLVRIATSKDVMETTLVLLLDMFGLLYVVTPMGEAVAHIDHPRGKEFVAELATFFIAITSAECGYWLQETLKEGKWWPPCSHSCGRSTLVGLIVSVGLGLVGACAPILCYENFHPDFLLALVLVGAVIVSQVSRWWLKSIKEMAQIAISHEHHWSIWNSGVMECVNPYLFASVIIHPYMKWRFTSS